MIIEWDKDDGTLVIDDELHHVDEDGSVEVRVPFLKQLRGRDLPPGLRVKAVRLVIGSGAEVYGDPEHVQFERTADAGHLLVHDALIVDPDDEPDSAVRTSMLNQMIAQARAELQVAAELGAVLSFEISDIYNEAIAYVHLTVPVADLDRTIYDLVQSVPDSYRQFLPPNTDGAVLAVLRSLAAAPRGEQAVEGYVRDLVRAVGHSPGDLRYQYPIAGGLVADAVLKPYDRFKPIVLFEWAGEAPADAAVAQARGLGEAAGAQATVVMSPHLIVVATALGALTVELSKASIGDAAKLLSLIGSDGVGVRLKDQLEPRGGDVRLNALTDALTKVGAARDVTAKGNTYEDLAALALEVLPSVRVKYRNLRTDTAEIDIVAEYVGEAPLFLLGEYGRYLLVECKNWNRPAGAKDLRDFAGKMRDGKVRLGVYFSRQGITGKDDRDAVGVTKRLFHQEGLLLVVVTQDDLRAVAAGEDFLGLLDRRADGVRFQFQ